MHLDETISNTLTRLFFFYILYSTLLAIIIFRTTIIKNSRYSILPLLSKSIERNRRPDCCHVKFLPVFIIHSWSQGSAKKSSVLLVSDLYWLLVSISFFVSIGFWFISVTGYHWSLKQNTKTVFFFSKIERNNTNNCFFSDPCLELKLADLARTIHIMTLIRSGGIRRNHFANLEHCANVLFCPASLTQID